MSDIQALAEEVKAAILRDVAAGRVPMNVGSFSALHDHVDANDYLIDAGIVPTETEGWTDTANAVMDVVDVWLKGRATPGTPESTLGAAKEALLFAEQQCMGCDSREPLTPGGERHDPDPGKIQPTPGRCCGARSTEMTSPPVVRANALPENSNKYRDTGCELYGACLACPRRLCQYDDSACRATDEQTVRVARDVEIVQKRSEGQSAIEIAVEFQVSARTIHRVLQRSDG